MVKKDALAAFKTKTRKKEKVSPALSAGMKEKMEEALQPAVSLLCIDKRDCGVISDVYCPF